MKLKKLMIVVFIILLLVSAICNIEAADLNIYVKTQNPTSISEVIYKINGMSKSINGSQATQTTNFAITGLNVGRYTLETSFGSYYIDLDEYGNISIPQGQSLTLNDNMLIIQNTINLDLLLRAVNATSTSEIIYQVRTCASTQMWRTVDAVKYIPGNQVQISTNISLSGMAPNQALILESNFGARYFTINNDGEIILSSDGLPLEVDNINHILTVQNTINLDLLLKAVNATSASEIIYQVRTCANTRMWRTVDAVKYIPGNQVQIGTNIILSGMAPNQALILENNFGSRYFTIDNDGAIILSSDGLPLEVDNINHILTVQNTINLDLLLKAVNATSASEIIYQVRTCANTRMWRTVDAVKYIPGNQVQIGTNIILSGMAPNQALILESNFGSRYFTIDNDGAIILSSDGLPLEVDNINHILTVQNTINFRLSIYTEIASSFSFINYQLQTNDLLLRVIDTAVSINGNEAYNSRIIMGTGLAMNQEVLLASTFGNIRFKLLTNGIVQFYMPAKQLTATKASYSIESGTNNLFLVILPPNSPPVIDAGDNFELLSENQATTVIIGSAFDPESDNLTYRWLEGNAVLVESTVIDQNCKLYLSSLPPLLTGTHTYQLEVTDGIYIVKDIINITVANSSPITVPNGGGIFEIGVNNNVILGGQISDFDGDLIDFEWKLDQNSLGSGTVKSLYGGNAVSLPQIIIGSTALCLGKHTIDLIINDGFNENVISQIIVEITDGTAPVLAPQATQTILWPANHQMVEVVIWANAFDNSGSGIELDVNVESSELPEFTSDGNFLPDFEILEVNNCTGFIRLNLRAERSGKGDGRTYQVVITAIDTCDNGSSAIILIKAPHDRRK